MIVNRDALVAQADACVPSGHDNEVAARAVYVGRLAAQRVAELEAVLDRANGNRPALLQRIERLQALADAGREAREALVLANQRLVVGEAWNAARQAGMDVDDLVQEGTLGLLRAIERFDPRHGCKLSTYAVPWIRQSISRYVAGDQTIRIPDHQYWRARRAAGRAEEMAQRDGRDPSPAEVNAAMVDAGDWAVMPAYQLASIIDVQSLDQELRGPDERNLTDVLVVDGDDPLDAAAASETAARLREVLDEIPAREAKVLRLRFGLDGGAPLNLEQIGDRLGVTRERVRQIEQRALKRLRHPRRARRLGGGW